MTNKNDFDAMVRALFERERDNFDFEALLNRAAATYPDVAIFFDMAREIAPCVFEAGFYAGANVGVELAKEIYRPFVQAVTKKA